MPLFSIILPVYNAEQYLSPCLNSIAAQTFKDFEVLVIDDGSTDSSAEICASYSSKLAGLRYFKQSNSGPSAARNLGINNATGQWILFVDADDIIKNSFLENFNSSIISEEFQSKAIDCALASFSTFKNNPELIIGTYVLPDLMITKAELAKCFLNLKLYRHGYPFAKIFSKRHLDINKIRFRNSIKFSEDLLFLLEVLSKSTIVLTLSHNCYFYREHKSGQSNRLFSFESEYECFCLYRDLAFTIAGKNCVLADTYLRRSLLERLLRSLKALYVCEVPRRPFRQRVTALKTVIASNESFRSDRSVVIYLLFFLSPALLDIFAQFRFFIARWLRPKVY